MGGAKKKKKKSTEGQRFKSIQKNNLGPSVNFFSCPINHGTEKKNFCPHVVEKRENFEPVKRENFEPVTRGGEKREF